MLSILLALFIHSASAAPETMECKKLDYSSYFVAQNLQSNLKSLNPDVSKPNFASHYLLLRSELLMENLWLVADCKTGKIFHEKLSGVAIEFKPDSDIVVLKVKNAPDESYAWNNESWMKLAASPEPTATITPVPGAKGKPGQSAPQVPAQPALQGYDTLFTRYPVSPQSMTCKALDYDSYFKAQNGKSNIQKLNGDLTHPNFAGKYVLVKNEIVFETLWYLADCETGKFFQTFISGNASFKPESSLVVLRSSGDLPRLMLWQDQQWYQIADPVQTAAPAVSNLLYGKKAKLIYDAIPVDKKSQRIQFDRIECKDSCTVKVHPDQQFTIDAKYTTDLKELIRVFGTSIEKGSCQVKNEPQCDVTFK